MDGHPDGLLLGSGSVLLGYGVGVYQGLFDTGLDALDLAVIRGASPAGLDAFATTSTSNTMLNWYVDGGNTLAEATLPGLADARRLRAADMNNNGQRDLFVLASTGQSFTWFPDISVTSSSPGNWQASSGITVPYPPGATALDFVPIDFDGGNLDDLVCLEQGSIALFRANGTRTVLGTFTGTPKALVAFRQAGYGFERVAAIYEAGGRSYLWVIDATGAEAPVDLGGIGVVSLAAVDGNLDGLGDLYVGQDTDSVVLNYQNTGLSGASFAHGASTTFSIDTAGTGTKSSTTLAWPALSDLDSDGDVELLYASARSEDLFCARGSTVDELTLVPQLVHSQKFNTTEHAFNYRCVMDRPSGLAANLDWLEVVQFFGDPQDNYELPSEVGSFAGVAAVGGSDIIAPLIPYTKIDPAGGGVAGVVYCFFRYVEHDSNGRVIDWSPTLVMAVGSTPAVADFSALHSTSGPSQTLSGDPGGIGIGSDDVPVRPPPGHTGGDPPNQGNTTGG